MVTRFMEWIVIREFAEYFGRCPWGATCLINSTCKSAGQLKLDQSALASWCWLIAELQNIEWAEVSMLFFLLQEENESLSCFHCLCLLGFRFFLSNLSIRLSLLLFISVSSIFSHPLSVLDWTSLYLYICIFKTIVSSLWIASTLYTLLRLFVFFPPPSCMSFTFSLISYLRVSLSLSVLIRSALRGGWSVALFLHCLMFATMTPLMTSCSVILGWSNKRKVTKKINSLYWHWCKCLHDIVFFLFLIFIDIFERHWVWLIILDWKTHFLP